MARQYEGVSGAKRDSQLSQRRSYHPVKYGCRCRVARGRVLVRGRPLQYWHDKAKRGYCPLRSRSPHRSGAQLHFHPLDPTRSECSSAATSVDVERSFSRGRLTMSHLRTGLADSTFRALMTYVKDDENRAAGAAEAAGPPAKKLKTSATSAVWKGKGKGILTLD
jgi:hypothetical protein